MDNFILKDENAVFYECGYSCDNDIFLNLGDNKFFITDARYGIEAKENARDVQIIISNDIISSARKLLREFGIKRLILNPKDFSLYEFTALSKDLFVDFDLRANFSQIKRIVKSKTEIDLLKQAAKFGANGFDAICEFVKNEPNLDEIRLNYEATNLLKNRGEFALSFEPITAINANAAKAHALPTKAALKRGDLFLLDAGVKFRRYCSDRTRTAEFTPEFTFGKEQKFSSAKKNEVYEIVKTAQDLAIKAVKPGVLACEVDAVAREFIAKNGYEKEFFHSTGHGVGLDIHELPIISSKSNTILREGMVFSVEPGIYLQGEFGVRIEDVVVVTKDGCEIL